MTSPNPERTISMVLIGVLQNYAPDPATSDWLANQYEGLKSGGLPPSAINRTLARWLHEGLSDRHWPWDGANLGTYSDVTVNGKVVAKATPGVRHLTTVGEKRGPKHKPLASK